MAVREDVYTYGDANRKDKLTAYDGKPITYDAIGNPLTYDGYTFTWQAGRQLKSMVNGSTNAQFTYDHNGLRVKKTVNGAATNYTLHGKQIQHLQKGNDNLHFFYDAQGRAAIVKFNNDYYTYGCNLQGDVVSLIDSTGKEVVQYAYDARGG